MRKFILAILLALICATPATMTSCAFLRGQHEQLHEMEQAKFEKLLFQVEAIARIGGRELKKRIEKEEVRVYIITALEVILKQNTTAALFELLGKLKIEPEYKDYIVPALSIATDLIEAATGTPFSLERLALESLHPRDVALIRALLEGLKDGLSETTLTITITNK